MNNRAKKILMLILFLFSLAIFQNFISLNKSVIFNDYKIAFNNNTIFSDRIEKYNIALNLTNITSYYSLKFELVRISYQIQLFDCNNNLILPSDLSLYYKLHVLCFIKIKSFNIYSLASIEENKYFKCSEFFKINENIQIYFLLYETENDGAIKTIIITFIKKINGSLRIYLMNIIAFVKGQNVYIQEFLKVVNIIFTFI